MLVANVSTRGSRRPGGPKPRWSAVVAVAAAAALVPLGARGAQAETVARVNGEPVTSAELERMAANPLTADQARQELGVEHPGRAELERLALRKLIQRRLMIQEAGRRDLAASEQELDAAIAALRRRFEDLRSFGAWMKEQGLDDASLFESVRGDLAVDRVRAALTAGVHVSDADVQRYYAAHAEDFRSEEVRLQIIAVRDEAAANEIVAALRAGADFGRTARQRSGGRRAAQGGDTGWVASDRLAPPVREAVATLKPREARGPLRRDSEFLIVRLYDRRRGASRTVAEARPEIERRLVPELQRATLQAWLAEQEKRSNVEVVARSAAH